MGGARPIAGGLVLDLGAMNRILEIDVSDLVARVEPGVILSDLATAAASQGLLFAHDPWSVKIATVGGAVGTNGVGYLAAGYGPMGAQVRGLEVVLANGEVFARNSAAKAAGPDVWRMFLGSEGTLGVMTRIDVQLYPQPETRRLLGFQFSSFPDGFYALSELHRQGLRPAMIDYEEVEEAERPLESPANLYLAFDGARDVAEAAAAAAARVCLHHDARDLGEDAARAFWDHRHDVAEWFASRPPSSWRTRRERFPDVYVNLTVPLGQVLNYSERVVEIARAHGVGVESFGIWGKLEFLSFTLTTEGTAAAAEVLRAATDAALRLAWQSGGSIEYCHGAGVRFAHLYAEELGPTRAFLQTIKRALDPKGILNPGKLGLA
jgi:FAD/FMN-containing dehydrogenase